MSETTSDENGERTQHEHRTKQAQARLASHPFTIAVRDVQTVETTLHEIFKPNAQELNGLLRAAAENEELAIELVQNVRRSLVAEAFQAQLAQRLHNYLASAYTLSEHTQTIMKARKKRLRRTGDSLEMPFKEMKQKLLGSPEVGFIRQVRNYIQHYAHVPITHSISITEVNTPGQTFKSEIKLDGPELLRWSGWAGSVKAWLSSTNQVELRPAVRTYTARVTGLNEWFIDQLHAEAEPLRAEHNDLVVAANAALAGVDMETARRIADDATRRRNSTELPDWGPPPTGTSPRQ